VYFFYITVRYIVCFFSLLVGQWRGEKVDRGDRERRKGERNGIEYLFLCVLRCNVIGKYIESLT